MDDQVKSSEQVVEAAAAHAEAVEAARVEHLATMLNSPELANVLENAVVRALGRGASENRYIDIGRIPFICDDISAIKISLDDIKKSLSTYPIVKLLVFSVVAIALLAVAGQILYTIGLGHSVSLP